MEWKVFSLSDIAHYSQGKQIPLNLQYLELNELRERFIRIVDFTSNWSQEPRFVDKDPKYLVNIDDIVMIRYGTPGKVFRGHKGIIANNLFKITFNEEIIDKDYAYWYLNQDSVYKQLMAGQSSSTMPAITFGMLKYIMVRVPPISYQRRIASILSSLDRKIELNNKINADLEEMAQAIFKNWFVDFEPFKDGKFVDSELGMIPEGWKVISLSEIMKYNGGSQPPASEFIDTYQEGYIRFIQIRDYDNDSHITYIPISKRNKLCDELDIMIARYGAALGRICWGLKGAYNVALAKVTPIKSYYREYLRCYLNTSYFYQSINNKGARCAQSGFNQSDINSYMIAFPIDETVVMNFNDLCSSIMDKRLSLKYENSRLSLLRDTLLPRLMSGELEVPE